MGIKGEATATRPFPSVLPKCRCSKSMAEAKLINKEELIKLLTAKLQSIEDAEADEQYTQLPDKFWEEMTVPRTTQTAPSEHELFHSESVKLSWLSKNFTSILFECLLKSLLNPFEKIFTFKFSKISY